MDVIPNDADYAGNKFHLGFERNGMANKETHIIALLITKALSCPCFFEEFMECLEQGNG